MEAAERTNDAAEIYAAAGVQLGSLLGLPVLDLWSEFQKYENWAEELLCDGLHLTPKGNTLVGTLVLETIKKHYPALQPEKIPFDVPDWLEMASSADGDATVAAYLSEAAGK